MMETNERVVEIIDSSARNGAGCESDVSALEQQLEEAEKQKRELTAAGWTWRDHDGTQVLAHPADPAVNIWFHPYTGEQLLSPRLVELLGKSVRDSAS